MASPPPPFTFSPEPDLHPIYPSAQDLDPQLSPHSSLTPGQRHVLAQHSLVRACTFADLNLLVYLVTDAAARAYVDLAAEDEDGLGLVSTTILGFGGGSERDVEREECVRLLVAEGADACAPDKAGWTALHHAALLSPPTLVSFLLTHGCSLLTKTRRGLTPLDILTAHSPIPGREDVALLLEEAMRERGWSGGRMEQRRRLEAERAQRESKRKALKHDIGRVLGLPDGWWGEERPDEDESDDDADEDADLVPPDMPFTPPPSYTTMLVFSPATLPRILDSLTYNVRPTLRCAEPARSLYLLARFACLICDDTWLEDLMGSAVDHIERIVFAKPDDLPLQAYWLFNMTALLHFLRCDSHVAEICDLLDLFTLLEGVIRAIYVFIIRVAERKMDPLLDTAFLDYAPHSEFDGLQFEGEWSFLRSLASGNKLTKKRHESTPPPTFPSTSSASLSSAHGAPPTPRASTSRPPSPSPSLQGFLAGSTTPTSTRFSWTQSLTRSRATSHLPLPSFGPDPAVSDPRRITSQFEALHALLALAGINPALITQIYSQVMYWTACEMFNRILTRKKYLCRSRAIQIGMNLSVLEEWVVNSGLPQGVESHFIPVRELLHWLQCCSSVVEFTTLVETIQTMKHLNPLQMRRAVRDYRYEVSEGRMSEECAQYLVQLQKDWERRRVKLGVEALRREMVEREYDREGSVSSLINDASESASHSASISTASTEKSDAQRGIDLLFGRDHERAAWSAPSSPEPLGELRDSRYMLPLVLPSDPRLLAAVPRGRAGMGAAPHGNGNGDARSASRAGRGAMAWRSWGRRLRMIGIETMEWVDGVRGMGRWAGGGFNDGYDGEDGEEAAEAETGSWGVRSEKSVRNGDVVGSDKVPAALTQKPMRKVSSRRGRESSSVGGDTTIPDTEANE